MDKTTKHILIVDDEEDLREILSFNLKGEGYKVTAVANANEALEQDLSSFSLMLLDVMMPGINGFKLAEIIRTERQIKTPIIFLTAKDSENDLLTGFNVGADDYISKPFSIKELQARIQALLVRLEIEATNPTTDPGSEIIRGSLNINLETKQVFVGERLVEFTRKELEILTLLAQNEGRVFSRSEILDRVWPGDVFVLERTVDVHITRIRKKLVNSDIKLQNRSGFGYCLVVLEEEDIKK